MQKPNPKTQTGIQKDVKESTHQLFAEYAKQLLELTLQILPKAQVTFKPQPYFMAKMTKQYILGNMRMKWT